MKTLLLTTCICNAENFKDLQRLIISLNKVDSVFFTHYILFQNVDNVDFDESEFTALAVNYKLVIEKKSSVISLSKARNLLIGVVKKSYTLDEFDFISFPDDDCWYPDGFWNNFVNTEKEYGFDLFYTDFSSTPSLIDFLPNQHNTSNLIRYASSNTTIYKSTVFSKIGFFDENYGVGAKNNGGEDLDFAIRANLHADNSYFVNKALIGHRNPLPEFRYKYFKGSFGILKKHKFKNKSLFYHFSRKFLIGIVFLLNRKIKLSDFKVIS